MAIFDYNSKELKDVDLYNGERAPSIRERFKGRTAKKGSKIPITKSYPKEFEHLKGTLPFKKDFDIAEYKKMLKAEGKKAPGTTPLKPIKPTLEFVNSKGRVVKIMEPNSGGISIQYFLKDL